MASGARSGSFVDQAERFLPTFDLGKSGGLAGRNEFDVDFDADTSAE